MTTTTSRTNARRRGRRMRFAAKRSGSMQTPQGDEEGDEAGHSAEKGETASLDD